MRSSATQGQGRESSWRCAARPPTTRPRAGAGRCRAVAMEHRHEAAREAGKKHGRSFRGLSNPTKLIEVSEIGKADPDDQRGRVTTFFDANDVATVNLRIIPGDVRPPFYPQLQATSKSRGSAAAKATILSAIIFTRESLLRSFAALKASPTVDRRRAAVRTQPDD